MWSNSCASGSTSPGPHRRVRQGARARSGIGFGKRIGDGTTEAISRRNEIGVGNSLLVTEEKLERALAKLEEGSYGRCDSCGGPIAPGRLEVAPESALCIDCARPSSSR